MRIYSNPFEAFREVERDLGEMGIEVQPQTMQDKFIADDPNYLTKEVRAYGFQIRNWKYDTDLMHAAVRYIATPPSASDPINVDELMAYIDAEFKDRTGMVAMNPGNSYKQRPAVWQEFLHNGKFAYTYSERLSVQLSKMVTELSMRPETRQAILNIHSNIQPRTYRRGFLGGGEDQMVHDVQPSADFYNMGGGGRIPCSMYYQLMIREKRLDLIYTMRSCDFITHFPIDIALALKLQTWVAEQLKIDVGMFTYFTGSLHAYAKDLSGRNIF